MKLQSKFNEHFPRPLTCILLVEVLLCGNSRAYNFRFVSKRLFLNALCYKNNRW